MKDAYSPRTRMRAFKNGPLRGTDSNQYGFYDIGPLRSILESDDVDENDFQVSALPIPRNNKEYKIVEQIARHPRISYGIVDKSKVVFLRVGNKRGWMTALNEQGFVVKGGPKTPKRAKQLHRPSLLSATFESLNVVYVDSDHYSDYDFNNPNSEVEEWMCQPEVLERLLDGGFVISSRLINKAIENIPMYNPLNSTDPMEYYLDPRVRTELVKDLSKSRVFNARLIGPTGMIKGNAFVAVDLPEGIDVITSDTNLKKELSNSIRWHFIAEPQGPKSHVSTDIQTLINNPKLFRKSDMEFWLREEYKKMFDHMINGKVLPNYKRVYERLWREDESIDDQELHARMTYNGYRWVSMGLSITNSPWLFKTFAISHAKPLQKRIPVPCALYEQIIPVSLARMAGWQGTVERGTIRRCMDLGVHIINDLDWLESYESHGGHDEDDFFKLFYREIEGGERDGEKSVVALRCPNGYGEYSIYKYVEGEEYPTWHTSDGTEISFPKVNGRGWPVRLSEAIRTQKVKYLGLPSDHSSKKTEYSPYYSVEDFLVNVRHSMTSGNVGGYVNSVMLHSLTLAKHRPYQLCSLESAIDGCTQTDDPEDRFAIDVEADLIVREVIDSGKPIDKFYWEQRGFAGRYKDADVELYIGKVSQVAQLCKKFYMEYCDKITEWAQQNARPAQLVDILGERMLLHAQADIRRFRRQIHEANNSPTNLSGIIQRTTWEMLYEKIADHIETFEHEQDKYDYVLALLSSSIKFPTTQGNITDQIVMNKTVYPYLERAFVHYGIGSLLQMKKNKNGKVQVNDLIVSNWVFTDPDGNQHHFDDPVQYQKFHQQFSPIKRVAPPLGSGPSTLKKLNIK
jgi:hypothetical protein